MLDTASSALNGTHAELSAPPDGARETHFAGAATLLEQVQRILHSEELRGAGVLRRLLKFLAEKSASGEADELKEYVIAIDGLGKPASYDPRHNSAVRIQVARLRQKLADYYRREGQGDPLVIDIPKGHFKLKCDIREASGLRTAGLSLEAAPNGVGSKKKLWVATSGMRWAPVAAGITIAISLGIAYYWMKPAGAKATSISYTPKWNADMEELWRPFTATNRPMIVAIEDPLFVELDGKKGIYYRDKTLNTWSEIKASPTVEALHGALKNRELAPSRYYTAFGEVDASFLLARLLGSRAENLSLVKTTDLSMRELTDNNVVFVGIENIFFNEQIQAAPVETPLQPVHEGIRDMHPGPNEPVVFLDKYSTAPSEEGVAYALVTHLPGPLGSNDVESFTSSRAAGYVAAVKAFTDPSFVRTLVSELKRSSGGKLPRYYQVLLKVKFTDQVPTEITFVLARQLHYPGKL